MQENKIYHVEQMFTESNFQFWSLQKWSSEPERGQKNIRFGNKYCWVPAYNYYLLADGTLMMDIVLRNLTQIV